MQEQEFKELLARIQNGTASEADKAFLENWYLQYRAEGRPAYSLEERLADANEVWAKLQPVASKPHSRRIWPRVAAAAAVFIAFSTGAYFILHRQNKAVDAVADIAPYSAVAVLKSGGKTILLDQVANGKIDATLVTKSPGEQLSYEPVTATRAATYDTIHIPAGGRPYTVQLSDGSKITLNAATTLRYPETFSANREEVIELISGEIYAIVVHNAAAPLQIKAPGQVITDIGTEFNVAAWPDEPDARTTLIEGAVKVSAGNKEEILTPGNQAILTANNLLSTAADLNKVTAWKNGLFRFNGEQIDVIMRQLSRWYNVDVKYQGAVTSEVFYGRIDRKRNISEVLNILERSKKVHFKIEGRVITVLSK